MYIFGDFTWKSIDKHPKFSYYGTAAGTFAPSGPRNEKRSIPMSIDLKAKIEELVSKLQKDPALLQSFQRDPVKALETLVGVDLPDEQIQPLVTGIKAKLAASGLGEALGGLKKLF